MAARRLYNLPEPTILFARGRLLELLSDLQWHHNRELRVAGVRYSARLLELRRLGYSVERRTAVGGHEYRLASLRRTAPRDKMVKVYMAEADARTAVNHRRVTESALTAISTGLASFVVNREKL